MTTELIQLDERTYEVACFVCRDRHIVAEGEQIDLLVCSDGPRPLCAVCAKELRKNLEFLSEGPSRMEAVLDAIDGYRPGTSWTEWVVLMGLALLAVVLLVWSLP